MTEDSATMGNETLDGKQLNDIKVEEINEDFGNFKKEEDFTGKTVETYFVTTDYGIKKQDNVKFDTSDETLLGIQVPFFYYMGRKQQEQNDDDIVIVRHFRKKNVKKRNIKNAENGGDPFFPN